MEMKISKAVQRQRNMLFTVAGADGFLTDESLIDIIKKYEYENNFSMFCCPLIISIM